jgi:predicted DNA-binding protein YlxM (UPF0122 family)
MPKKRTSMTNIKEVLRLKYECDLSIRQIAACTKVGRSTISDILHRIDDLSHRFVVVYGHTDQQPNHTLEG